MTTKLEKLYAQQAELLKARKRLDATATARDSLLGYMALTMPDPNDPDDVTLSKYQITPQARLLCQIIEKVERGDKDMRMVAVSIGPQMGKALDINTPIPTPSGFTKIGDLKPGDIVFDDRGAACRVIAKTPVWENRPCYEVSSDDGFSVVADAEHEWHVRVSKSHSVWKPKTTQHLAEKDVLRNPLLQQSGALELPEVSLPVDPYVLGVWLGDGGSDWGAVTAMGEDGVFIEQQVQAAGYVTRRRKDGKSFGVMGLGAKLRDLGVLHNKHIPQAYLRASKAQRLALLQGLVDTDGHVQPKGHVEYCSITPDLARACRELVVSLGVKCQIYDKPATLYGKYCGQKYSVCFFLADAARLPRKRERCRGVSRCAGRYLTFKQVEPQSTVCIEVDSPSHQFLCGHGMLATCNSQILSRGAPAWLSGRLPERNIILGSYNQDFANEFGDDVRAILQSSAHKQVFPEHELRKGGQAKDLLITTKNGKMAFVGVGGSGTGKPADLFIVDDPIRNDDDAQSPAYRNRMWNWFNKVAGTRIHNNSAMIVVHTRWHEDDLIGRLCDPDHPLRNKDYIGIADDWTYINLPAVVDDPKLAEALGLTLRVQQDELVRSQFGVKPIAALWPEKFDLEFLAKRKRMDKRGFTALRMGKPSPEDGDYFKAADLVEYYSPAELPRSLRKYGASDHAVTEKQKNDASVIGCVGIDENDDIWVLPDLVWDRMETDGIVEALLAQFKAHKPLLWWMESENISKSFGPFLRKRMYEEKVYVAIDPVTVSKDKKSRARSIQGRMQMRKVHFPAFAPWWADAKNEVLKFPYGTHDDFVDWLAHIGQGLTKENSATAERPSNDNVVRVGSMAWVLAQTKSRERNDERKKVNAKW